MRFVKAAAGRNYIATSEDAVIYELRADGRFAGTSAALVGDKSREVVTATGWVATSMSGNPMNQLVSGKWICTWDGWQATESMGAQYSQKSAQEYVNKVIENNKRILENNLVCARFAYKLTSAQRQQLIGLQQRLEERNDSLLKDGLVTPQTTSAPAGYAELQSYLSDVMTQGVGSLTAAIVIAAVVIASLSTAAYFCYKYYASESEQDVKFSDELTKTLTSKLTDEEYEQLLQETKGIVTRAKIRSRFSKTGVLAVVAAAAIAAGLFLYKRQ